MLPHPKTSTPISAFGLSVFAPIKKLGTPLTPGVMRLLVA